MKPTKEICGRCTNSACECSNCFVAGCVDKPAVCEECEFAIVACIPNFAEPCEGCNSAHVDSVGEEEGVD